MLLCEVIFGLVAAENFTLNGCLKRQLAQFFDLVEDILHFLAGCYEFATLAIHFILHYVAAIALLRSNSCLKIDHRYLAVLQVAQRCQIALKRFFPSAGL